MKKTIILSCLIILSLSIIYISDAQDNSCYEPIPSGLVCGNWNYSTVIRPFEPFSTCNITFGYRWRSCTDNNCNPPQTTLQYEFINIDIPEDCVDLMQHLFPGYPNNWSDLNGPIFWDFIDAIFRTLGKEVFELNPINCSGQPPHCNRPTGCNFQIYYAIPKCVAYCLIFGISSSFR